MVLNMDTNPHTNSINKINGSTASEPAGLQTQLSSSGRGMKITMSTGSTTKTIPDNQPTSPSADSGRSVAVDYIKNRYEKGSEMGIKIPQVLREPKKLEGEWDKMMDDKQKRQEDSTPVLKEQDILALVMACTGVDSKAQYLNMLAEKDTPVNKQEVEKVAPPEITKNVRKMFESGNAGGYQQQQKRISLYEKSSDSVESGSKITADEGITKCDANEEEGTIVRGFTKAMMSQWQNMETKNETGKDGLFSESQILSGTTKDLRAQWAMKGTTASAPQEKLPIKLHDIRNCDGMVSENKPLIRSDVIRETDPQATENEHAQAGTTKDLLNKWSNLGGTEFSLNRGACIEIPKNTQSDVFENQPLVRNDVIRESDNIGEGDTIQIGLMKNIMNQYKLKSGEEFKIDRKPINVAESEGKVSENNPTRNTDVINAVGVLDEEPAIASGITKSLVSQWKNIGSAEFKPERSSIIIAEDSGYVAENEPVQRVDILQQLAEDTPEKVVKTGMTKQLSGMWSTVGQREILTNKTPLVVYDGDNKVLENDPVIRTDVIRETDQACDTEHVKQGTTKSLLNQWKSKGNEEFKIDRRPIDIHEAPDTISENQPITRDDVVREVYVDETKQQIRPDITKTLRNQWTNIGKNEEKQKRSSVILAEDEGRVCENIPVVRSDVVREQDVIQQDRIQRGTTRTLLSQWTDITSEKSPSPRAPVNILEEEGCVSENQPTVRQDVVRQYDSNDVNQIRSGFLKNVKQEWMNKGKEEFKRQQSAIVLAEDEGKIAENNPVVRDDVIRENSGNESTCIQRGFTKSMLSEWQDMGKKSFTPEKSPIKVAEDEGRVSENIPSVRDDVVREIGYIDDTKAVQRGTTKSLLQQWKSKNSEDVVVSKKPIVLAEDSGTISENQPETRADVTREYNVVEEEKIERGNTKGAINRWINKTSEQYTQEKKTINIMEDEGKISENTPVYNADIIKSEYNNSEDRIEQGLTKQLTAKWKTKGADNVKIDRQPINIYEGEDKTVENEPIQRDDVIRESTNIHDLNKIKRGFTKSLKNEWKAKGQETFQIVREPVNIAEDEGRVAENEPIVRTDVVREETPSDIIQSGLTKQMAHQWKTMGKEEFKIERAPISIAEGEGKVAENEPEVRTDVVREEDKDIERIKRGTTQKLKDRWKTMGNEEFVINRPPVNISEDSGTVSENQPQQRNDLIREEEPAVDHVIASGMAKNLKSQWMSKGTEQFTIDRAPINVAEDEGKVSENVPQVRKDIIREQDVLEEDKIRRGLTKSMTTQWKKMGNEGFVINRPPINVSEGDGKVVENEPEVRTDLVRESDLELETVQAGITKSLKNQWLAKVGEEYKINRSPINVAEDEGRIAENEPVMSNDISLAYNQEEVAPGLTKSLTEQWQSKSKQKFIRDAEKSDNISENLDGNLGEEEKIEKGITKRLTNQWANKSSNGFEVKRKSINLNEGVGHILESTPEQRTDVAREYDINLEEESVKRGFTKNMVGQWKEKEFQKFKIDRKAINVKESEGQILENEPEVLDDVAKESDYLPEKTSIQESKNVRNLWNRRENNLLVDEDGYEDGEPRELISFTPPRERSPLLEGFGSYHSVTLSSGGSTPAVTGRFTPQLDNQLPSWFPRAPEPGFTSNEEEILGSRRGSCTQLHIMPSSVSKNKNKGQPLRPYQQRRLMQEQQQQQQRLHQQQLMEQQVLHHKLLQQQLEQERYEQQDEQREQKSRQVRTILQNPDINNLLNIDSLAESYKIENDNKKRSSVTINLKPS